MEFNQLDGSVLDFLLTRRSAKARDLVEPGPDADQLELILQAGMRVPDHGKLAPWRFIIVEGGAQAALGRAIGEAYASEEEGATDVTRRGLQEFPCQAPLLIVVASKVDATSAIPEWEQRLSSGLAAYNILLAAHAQGFGGGWLTGWCAYSEGVKSAMGLEPQDRITGFIFIGTRSRPLKERPRPDYDAIVQRLDAEG